MHRAAFFGTGKEGGSCFAIGELHDIQKVLGS